MAQYNDRPIPSWYEKTVFPSIEFPSKARRFYAGMTFFVMLFLILGLAPAAYYFAQQVFTVSNHGIFPYFLLTFYIYFCYAFKSSFKDYRESWSMSDVEALWHMRHDPVGPKNLDGIYEERWLQFFPHWAERIDPETGNVDPNRPPSDKPWREVKEDVRAMMQQSHQKKLGLSKPKGRHSY